MADQSSKSRANLGPDSERPGFAPDSIRRNTAFALVTQISTSLVTACLTLFLVRALGPADYGVYALAFAIGGVLLLPSDLGISPATSRFVAERRGDSVAIAGVFLDAFRLKLAVSLTLSLALALAAEPISQLYDEPELVWPVRAFAIVLLGLSIARLVAGVFIGMGRIALNFRVSTTAGVLEALSAVVLVLAGAGAAGAAFGRAIGWAIGASVGMVVMLRFLGRTARRASRSERRFTRRIVRYAGAVALVDVTYSLLDQIDALLIGAYLSADAVGQFQAPMRLVTFLHLPGLAIASAVAPRLAREGARGPDVDAFRVALRLVILLQATLVAPLVVWASPIVSLLFGPEFEDSVAVLRGLAGFVFLLGIAPLVSLTANYLGEARRRIPIAVAALVANALVTAVLLPRIGISAAVLGTTIGFLLYVPAHVWLCRLELGVPLRPVVLTLGRCALAAAAMAGVLALVGTETLSPSQWALGVLGGAGAFLAVLALTRELTGRDAAAALALLRTRPRARAG